MTRPCQLLTQPEIDELVEAYRRGEVDRDTTPAPPHPAPPHPGALQFEARIRESSEWRARLENLCEVAT